MTEDGLTPSEQFVARLCTESFLSLWCHPNPCASPGKELCDLLVVCDPDIIIISVKECSLQKDDDGNTTDVGIARWTRRAVERSIEQVSGAERFLTRAVRVTRSDGIPGVELPPLEKRRIHRIAVAFGGERKVPIVLSAEGARGFVHIFDETAFETLVQELDTISDFVHYLLKKEELFQHAPIAIEGEENLLALYLLHGRTFPPIDGALHVKDGWWHQLHAAPAFRRKKAADRISYAWDHLIEHLVRESLDGRLELSGTMDEMERAVRILAREPRHARRQLAEQFHSFLERVASNRDPCGRALSSPQNPAIGYVFMWAGDLGYEERNMELVVRCGVARGMLPGCISVVGVCALPEGPGVVAEVALLHKPEWSDEDEALARQWRDNGMFAAPRHVPSDPEYPPET